MLVQRRMLPRSFVLVITLLSLTPPALVAQTPPDHADACANGALPSNIDMHPKLAPIAEALLARSASFVNQCQRLARARVVRIDVTLNPRIPTAVYRAITSIERFSSGLIVAHVELALSSEYEELLAHEFEHVIEQLDGVALRRLARVRGSGVMRTETGAFETKRAIDAGLAVSREVRTVAGGLQRSRSR